MCTPSVRFCGKALVAFLCVLFLPETCVLALEEDLAELIATAQDTEREEELRVHALDEIDMLRIRGATLKSTIVVLKRLLEDESAAVRTKSARVLFDLDHPIEELLPTAIDGLQNKDSEARLDACYLLWDFGYRAAPAIDLLVRSLSDNDPRVRSLAAILLGTIGPDHKEKSIPPLTRSLKDADRSVRVSAAEALAKVDGPIDQAVEVLIEAVRESSMKGDDYSPMSDEYDLAGRIGELGGDAIPAVTVLNEAMKQGGSYRQTASAKAVGEIGSGLSPALEGLAIALRNGEVKGMPFVHHSWCASDEAATALAVMGIEAAPTLIAALSDPDERVRANAANALGKIPVASHLSVEKLADRLVDEDPAVRSHAAWALGRIGRTDHGRETIMKNSDDITGSLVKLLFEDTEWSSSPGFSGITQSFSVPWHAVEAIARIQPDQKELIDAFESSLKNEQSINAAAATAIAAIGSDAKTLIPSLKPLLSNIAFRAPAAYAIASIDPATPGLSNALESSLIKSKADWPDLNEERDIDRVAARGLALMGARASSSVPRLKEAIGVATASRYVGNSGKIIVCSLAILQIDPDDQEASRTLLDALDKSHGAFDETAIDAAAEAIPELLSRQEQLRSSVIKRLSDQDVEVRLRSAAYLTHANLAQKETVKALGEIARQGRYQIREEAVGLLVKHGEAANGLTDLLTEYLSDDEVFHVGGDFYGNGGTPRNVREQAITALAAIGNDAVPTLMIKLDDSHHLVRAAAAMSFGLMGSDGNPATERLIQLTRDKSQHVRLASVVALGRIGSSRPIVDEGILGVLRISLKDPRFAVRQASRAALDRLQSADRSR